jgi:hypothetical protein
MSSPAKVRCAVLRWAVGRSGGQPRHTGCCGLGVAADSGMQRGVNAFLNSYTDDGRWSAFASALHPHTVQVYDLSPDRGYVENTSASVYATVRDNRCLQFGYSKDHHPALPQVKVRQAVLDPWGMPRATDVGSGERAAAPRSLPWIARRQARCSRRGRRAPRARPRVIFICVRCLRSNWPRASWTQPSRRFGVVSSLSARSCGRGHRANRSCSPRGMNSPWR